MTTSISIVAYLALFAGLGLLFLLVNLLVGRLVRPDDPHAEKSEIYECGEPTIGSSFVQFDLRFYVIALLFIIFDVEVAFFFPWATVFGKATNLSDPNVPAVVSVEQPSKPAELRLTPAAASVMREMGIRNPVPPPVLTQLPADVIEHLGSNPTDAAVSGHLLQSSAKTMGLISIYDIGVFFGVLMVGFAYVWRRGDLDWVRAVSSERALNPRPPTAAEELEPAMSVR
ncbi:MAG: NADH-quinone oxidoreductase subunit A [Planctomycetota bacterium]|nr:NADH-quinone oxidoreductase subunit A [Planctomycetota bacterium]